jgi:hypothetical protein
MMISVLPESALFKALSGFFFFAMRSILWVYFGGYLT